MSVLPVVSDGVRHAVHAEMRNHPTFEYSVLENMVRDNPILAEFALMQIRQLALKDTNAAAAVKYALAIMYRLLESQAEADALNSQE